MTLFLCGLVLGFALGASSVLVWGLVASARLAQRKLAPQPAVPRLDPVSVARELLAAIPRPTDGSAVFLGRSRGIV